MLDDLAAELAAGGGDVAALAPAHGDVHVCGGDPGREGVDALVVGGAEPREVALVGVERDEVDLDRDAAQQAWQPTRVVER